MKLIIDIDEEIYKMCKRLLGDADEIERAIANGMLLPTVEPCYQTTSCLDCKMYDKENHHCPRFCEVIRELVKEKENDRIYCKDCEFCKKKADWKWCDDFGVSPYYCTKGRGLDIVETVNLNDFCSLARIKEINDEEEEND